VAADAGCTCTTRRDGDGWRVTLARPPLIES
jgi:hypothetical protein